MTSNLTPPPSPHHCTVTREHRESYLAECSDCPSMNAYDYFWTRAAAARTAEMHERSNGKVWVWW